MPHKSVWKQKGVIWQFEGEVDFEELQQVHSEFFFQPEKRPHPLSDIRYAPDFEIQAE